MRGDESLRPPSSGSADEADSLSSDDVLNMLGDDTALAPAPTPATARGPLQLEVTQTFSQRTARDGIVISVLKRFKIALRQFCLDESGTRRMSVKPTVYRITLLCNHTPVSQLFSVWKERLHAFNVCFAAHLKQQGIDSVIPQPFVDKVAEHLKPKKPPSAPMVRRSNCTSCGKLFFLDGWQADSKHCSGCRRSTVVDGAKMPTAFFHRKDGRFTSVVSESIGRRNGVV